MESGSEMQTRSDFPRRDSLKPVGLFLVRAAVLGTLFLHTESASGNTGEPVWVGDVAISTAPGEQGVAHIGPPGISMVADGAGGAIIVWDDSGSGNVAAQRVNGSGQPQWATNGLPVAPASWFQFGPRGISDGTGGVIVAWVDGRSDIRFCNPTFKGECDIFAQRINGAGQPLWQALGVPISTAPANQGTSGIAIASDGEGGAIMAWEDARPPNCCRIFAQRISANGHVVWTTDGIPISPPPTFSIGPIGAPPLVASDGVGGAIIAWLNVQVNPISDRPTISLQRVDRNGQALWVPGGVAAGFPSHDFSMSSDGAGGAIIAFAGLGPGSNLHDIFAQRISSNGQILWQPGGVPIAIAPNSQVNPQITGDGQGGAIIVWQDERNVTSFPGGCFGSFGNCDIFAQRVSAAGQVLWQANGIPISTAPNNQRSPRLVGDGSGGAIIAWQDCRAFFDRDFCIAQSDLYAQRVNASGQVLWQRDGIPVSGAAGNQGVDYGSDLTSSMVMVSDNAAGAILAWPDGRNGICEFTIFLTECDVYAQRVSDQVSTSPLPSPLTNLSTRSLVQTGDDVLIGGFIIGGTSPKTVLLRALGPTLASFGVPGVLPNPTLTLFSGSTPIARNDDWQFTFDSLCASSGHTCGGASDIFDTGLAPSSTLEAALLITLAPGPYTAIVSGVGGSTGVGLVEVYDVYGDPLASRLLNLSTRSLVQTGDDVMIGGFIIGGTTPKTVLVRAIGPSLVAFGVPGVLANPTVTLFSGPTPIARNDDWQVTDPLCASSGHTCGTPADIAATGLPPSQPAESALLITLAPGPYTAIVTGVGGGTGVGLVEVFDVGGP
jgi:hypothetical protein